MCNHDEGARYDSCTSPSSNRPTNDECRGVGRGATYKTTKLKYGQCHKKGPFDVEHLVYPSIGWHKRTCGDKIRAAIPANIVIGMELVCDTGNSLMEKDMSALFNLSPSVQMVSLQ